MSRVAAEPSGPECPPSEVTATRRPSLAELYAAHFRFVWRCLRSLGVYDRMLDDAVQDVFVVVDKKLSSFDGGVEPRTWLYAILLRVARRYRERAAREWRRHAPVEELELAPASLQRLEPTAEQGERLRLARQALEALDDDKREVFVLSQIEQLSAPEIATVVGVPVNTVYSRLRASRMAFASEIQRLESGTRRPLP